MEHHHHDHDHGAGGHTHHISADADAGKLKIALALIVGLMIIEIVAGVIAHSLALLSDAGHMLTDAGAIALALVAARLAARPAKGIWTYGFKRMEILSALINGVTLVVLGGFITYEAIDRVVHPPTVKASLVLVVALVGVAVNLLATLTLAKANRESLNIEGSFQHLLTDLYAFIGTAIAAVVILITDFQEADPIASLMVAGLMFRSGYVLTREAGRVILEAAPRGIDPEELGRTLARQKGVVEIHDLHVWEVTSGFPALSAHVTVKDAVDCHQTRRELESLLHSHFHIEHTTLQVDHESGQLLTVEMP